MQQPTFHNAEEPDFNAIQMILKTCNLLNYYEVIVDNGFDDIDTFLELNMDHLQSLEIPLGHRIKIDKAIQKYKNENGLITSNSINNIQIKLPQEPKVNQSPRKFIHSNNIKEHTKVN